MMLSRTLFILGSTIYFILGLLHIYLTFGTNKFQTRNAELTEQMKQVAPVVSNDTTVWKAWIGFNASHSLGLMVYGAIFAFLAGFHHSMLMDSPFLLVLMIGTAVCYPVLAKRYWFSVPFWGLAAGLACFVCGVALGHV
jgi:hypothetical protein